MQKYVFYMAFVKVCIYFVLLVTICTILAGIQSWTFAAKDVKCMGC